MWQMRYLPHLQPQPLAPLFRSLNKRLEPLFTMAWRPHYAATNFYRNGGQNGLLAVYTNGGIYAFQEGTFKTLSLYLTAFCFC